MRCMEQADRVGVNYGNAVALVHIFLCDLGAFAVNALDLNLFINLHFSIYHFPFSIPLYAG